MSDGSGQGAPRKHVGPANDRAKPTETSTLVSAGSSTSAAENALIRRDFDLAQSASLGFDPSLSPPGKSVLKVVIVGRRR
jgi:hypothetical protein